MQEQAQQTQEKESLEMLRGYKIYFERQAKIGFDKVERLEMLMKRRSAKKLTAEKKQRMFRRHMAAQQQASSSMKMLDDVNLKIVNQMRETT